MKLSVAIVTLIALLTATVPATAQETPASTPATSSHGPMFIVRGTPLTVQETASMNQRMALNGRISHDAGGEGDDEDAITRADEVFVGVVVIAVVAGLVYLTVVETQKGSKLF